MSAPKMILDGIAINQHPYGYTSEVYTGIKWDLIGDNYRGYYNGSRYCQLKLPNLMLDETMQDALLVKYDENVTLTLDTDHGFYPFTPLFQELSYSVRCLHHEYTGLQQSPWKYTENSLTFLYNGTIPAYTNVETPTEGNITLWDGVVTIVGGEYVFPRKVDGIQELAAPPELTLPEYYNVAITQTGKASSLLSKRSLLEKSGMITSIELKGSLAKTAQILKFFLDMGATTFYIGCPISLVTVQPSGATQVPEYWMFGRKIPMSKYMTTGHWFYAWAVKCISNPIEITHNHLNNFSIKVKLALVI